MTASTLLSLLPCLAQLQNSLSSLDFEPAPAENNFINSTSKVDLTVNVVCSTSPLPSLVQRDPVNRRPWIHQCKRQSNPHQILYHGEVPALRRARNLAGLLGTSLGFTRQQQPTASHNSLTTAINRKSMELKENTTIVVLGASGDLAKKKTVRASDDPASCHLYLY